MEMAKEKKILSLLLGIGLLLGILVFAFSAFSYPGRNSDMLGMEPKYTIVTANVTYFDGTKGYLARPDSEGKFPGVIMIHEWWGLNDNIKQMARSLASQGYVVLAVDLYDGKVATTTDQATAL